MNCKHNKKIYAPFKPWYMSKVVEKCKHNNDKMKCTKCWNEKFPWCNKCNKSKVAFNTIVPTGNSGTREGGRDSICRCDTI